MRTEELRPIRLVDYAPPAFTITDVRLDVDLTPDRTVVTNEMQVKRIGEAAAPLVLNGEGLELLSVAIDGRDLAEAEYTADKDGLTIPNMSQSAKITVKSAFSPAKNTTLSGIYVSNHRIFSQCEPEGFRRITYFIDRPDILSRYETKITADKSNYPFLLSNGNKVDAGDLDDGRHWALWRDPFPKPSYLFALVAGEFDLIEDTFTTMSGREVDLRVFVDPGDAARAHYALDSLKRAMAWDETAYGREYDLDLFMIVAVRDFNFGAMENKGLNIFNSSLLLADPDSATDADYERIEGVVAHEYFHNWTGNRITCRDWFQLCLKEGLTVFRDQSFSSDYRGDALSRIKSVRGLRARQFPEDAGPLAHPVRPQSYLKIDNFYTSTVYEKGAELIRALKEILGPDDFRAGMDLYFERCDGAAATMEDFLACFTDASGRDLTPFLTWYNQAGTPRVRITTHHDEHADTLDITLSQSTPDTPGQSGKQPVPIPVKLGLIGKDGANLPIHVQGDNAAHKPSERTLVLENAEQTWRLEHVPPKTVVSALRGFSAPVILEQDTPVSDLARRAAYDDDAFNRWEAAQDLAKRAMLARLDKGGAPEAELESAWRVACAQALTRAADDPGIAAATLAAPDEMELAQHVAMVDPDEIRHVRKDFMRDTASGLLDDFEAILKNVGSKPPFEPTAEQANHRSLYALCLAYLAYADPKQAATRAEQLLNQADNLTDRLSALSTLDTAQADAYEPALEKFYAQWADNALVVDKWFSLQARTRRVDALDRIAKLVTHPAYDARTPNRIYSVLGAFGFGNLAAFHHASGEGYRLFVDHVLDIDGRNPAVAARLLSAFEIWPRLEPNRRELAQKALERVRDADSVSPNLLEIASKSLGEDA